MGQINNTQDLSRSDSIININLIVSQNRVLLNAIMR
jgi:hypothetical protein